MSALLERARRAARKSPRQLASRLIEMGRSQLQRPWSRVYPHLLTERGLVKLTGATSIDALWQTQQAAPFFVSPDRRAEWTRAFRVRYLGAPAAILGAADRAVRHEFDLLGSGCVALSPRLPWHTDFKTGREWPLDYSPHLDYLEIDKPTDVKVPWELSRCQHFTALGQAYWLTGDERYAREFVDETSDWIARNPWGHGVNWACAMDVALRAVSWIWGFYFLADAAACRSRSFRGELLRSLYMHGEYIAGHIERGEVNGNHYLCDAVGLVFIGSFFRTTPKGRQWLQTGKAMIDAEIFSQTSEDGVDFEKSTAYHRLVLEAFLTCYLLLDLRGDRMSPEWIARLGRMLEFVEAYVKPDGTIPLVGDADDGRIQKLGVQAINDHRYLLAAGAVIFGRADFKRAAASFADEAFWLFGPDGGVRFDAIQGASPAVESKAFDAGGFYVLRTDRAHVFIDCGEVGMHGRGGHGHSDITSLEIWLDGMNLVSDCGAYLYTASREWRNLFRSTAFHNVVQIDGEELNRLVSPDNLWHLRDDARPQNVLWRWDPRADYFRGTHNGYLRLEPPALVTREVLLVKEGLEVLIRDSIEGRGAHELVWRFHLDPALDAAVEGSDVRLRTGGRDAWLQLASAADGLTMTIEDGWISPSYGVRTGNRVVTLRGRVMLPQVVSFRCGLVRTSLDRMRAMTVSMAADTRASLVGQPGDHAEVG
jgi:Heparinase II/III-like protein/Heparinase II/III N-terminus